MSGTGVTMCFRKIVSSGLSVNTIRLATATSFGHRVSVDVTVTSLAGIFKWSRTKNTSVPKSILNSDIANGKNKLAALIAQALTTTLTDRDSNSNGLDFNSTTMTAMEAVNPSVRATAASGSANDLVMAYVLFRCFGKTNYGDISQIYNLADAHNMVLDADIGDAIATSMENNAPEVENFLKEQLKYDTARYITSNTLPTGMFDSNGNDAELTDSSGDMVFVSGDVIEIPVRLVFRAPVTVANMSDDVVYSSGFDQSTGVDKQVITGEASAWDPNTATAAPAVGNVLAFRLQLTVA